MKKITFNTKQIKNIIEQFEECKPLINVEQTLNDNISKYEWDKQVEYYDLIVKINEIYGHLGYGYLYDISKYILKPYDPYEFDKINNYLTTILSEKWENFTTPSSYNDELRECLNDYISENNIFSFSELKDTINESFLEYGLESGWINLIPEYLKLDEEYKYFKANEYLDDFENKYKDLSEIFGEMYELEFEKVNEAFFEGLSLLD